MSNWNQPAQKPDHSEDVLLCLKEGYAVGYVWFGEWCSSYTDEPIDERVIKWREIDE